MYLVTALLMRIGSRAECSPGPSRLAETIRSHQRPDDAGHTAALAHLHTVVGPDRVHVALFMEAADPADAETTALSFLTGVLADRRSSDGWVLAAFARVESSSTTEPRGQGTTCRGAVPPFP
ncbi:hypothetical protein [Streptomyces sp. NPDC005953]|uniref:hypothetical protein n=1 Tax=unclassified Streptomyces TaxID=2593676 RepID=UPI0034092BF1